MVDVAGVRFKNIGKIYYFDPGDFELKPGCGVIVETARGMEFGNYLLNLTLAPLIGAKIGRAHV